MDCVAAVPGDDDAAVALEEFRAAIGESAQFVTLSPGDILLIDNKRALHARTSFRPRYDGTDRWLQRISITKDLARSAPFRTHRHRAIDLGAREFR
jgi:alpha-ketoglutarate-dependent taurine dioxygenase